ncbi:MAG: hypothetical protein ABMA25_07940 [Ilumatobacteraceae bacterium]
MNTLTDHLVTVAVLYGCGLPITLSALNSRVLAVALAPLCTGLLAVLAVLGSLLTGTALAPWLVLWLLAGWAGAAWWWRQGRGHGRSPTVPWWAAGPVVLLTAPALLATNAAAIEWDARSIWWFHAAWFRQGGEVARAAMNNDAFQFAHADYPPFAPATQAMIWTGYHDLDRMLAKAVGAHLTFAAVALLCLLLVRLAPAAHRRWVAATAVLAGLFGLGLFGVGNGNGTSGLVDLLWAVLFAAGALALLIAPRDHDSLAVGWVAIAAAGLTKNEALSAIVLLFVLLAVRNGRQWKSTAWAATAIVPAMAWTLVRAVFTDAGNDALRPGGVAALLTGDEARTSRVSPTLTAVWGEVGPTVWVWLVVALAGLALLRRRRDGLGLGAAWVLPALAVGMAATLALVYVAGDQDITWWLATSISRTTIVLRVLLLADMFLWVLTAAAAVGEPTSDSAEIRGDWRP